MIGRICWVFPTISIRFLHEMNQRALFISLRNARDEREKADALRGPDPFALIYLNVL